MKVMLLVLAMAAWLVAGCGGGSAASSSAASTHKKDTSGCLVGSGNCGTASAACKAAEQTIQTELANTAKPTIEITTGVAQPQLITKAKLAKDKDKIRAVIARLEALRSTYLACPSHDPNFDANIAALKSYLK